uniref:ABC transmembrane type-1 domain-containing protein n=1 Tax=Ascaris lumbricoides TaxID=6252 RepID=A0A0M3IDX3_ASCLU
MAIKSNHKRRDNLLSVPLLRSFRKRQSDEPKETPPPKASLKQLLRYSSTFDRVLFAIGSLVAIGTGCGFPLLSILMGNMSQSFVDAQTAYNLGLRPQLNTTADPDIEVPASLENFTWDGFSDQVVSYCIDYVWIGIAILCAATIQVMNVCLVMISII